MRFVYKQKRYGLGRSIQEIERLFLNSKHLQGGFYQPWLSLTAYKRHKFLEEIKGILRRELIGKELMTAIALDILEDGVIKTDTKVYRYLKSKVYKGNLRLMLSEMQSILEASPKGEKGG